MPQPQKKHPRREDSAEAEDNTTTVEVSLLESINNKLAILELLHQDIKELKTSLEFSQSQIETLQKENNELQTMIATLTSKVNNLTSENIKMKETILDLQCRSMRDNLIFSGIPETTQEKTEETVKEFIHSTLKLPMTTVNTISFHRVHRIGQINTDHKRPRPIIVKFEHYKHKELVKSKGRELRGTQFGLNDQFPREIQERRKKLIPIMKQLRKEGKRATLNIDKLYVNGQLYRDTDTTRI